MANVLELTPGMVFVNNYQSVTTSAILAADTAIALESAAALEGLPLSQPAAGAAGTFENAAPGVVVALTLVSPDAEPPVSVADLEIVYMYASTAGVVDVLRAREGTVAKDWPAGTIVSARQTAFQANNINSFMKSDGSLHLTSGDFIPDGATEPQLEPNYNLVVGTAHGRVNRGSISISASTGPVRYLIGGVDTPESFNLGGGIFGDPSGIGNINIGWGTIFDNMAPMNESINLGLGGAGGESAINIGAGYAGDHAINIGGDGAFGVSAPGDGPVRIGSGGGASGDAGATSVGGGADANATSAAAYGHNANASANAAAAIGSGATASHADSVALGSNAATTTTNQVAIGNKDLEIGTATSSRGVHLYSPDGTRYLITVDNAGAVSAAADPIV